MNITLQTWKQVRKSQKQGYLFGIIIKCFFVLIEKNNHVPFRKKM